MAASAVSLNFLKRFVESIDSDWRTIDVTFDRIVPDTASRLCRYTDTMNPAEVGRPTYFVSHCWTDNFKALVETLTIFYGTLQMQMQAEQNLPSLPQFECFFWLDIFAVTQHPGREQKDDLDELAAAVKLAEKGVVFVMDNKGKALTRIWCLFELWKTCTLRPKGAEDLLVLVPLMIDFESLSHVWLNLDVGKAEATIEADRVRILAEIARSSTGHAELNTILKASIITSSDASYRTMERMNSRVAVAEAPKEAGFFKGLLNKAVMAGAKWGLRSTYEAALLRHTRILHMAGHHAKAEPFARQHLKLMRDKDASTDDMAASTWALGLILAAQGKQAEAKTILTEALQAWTDAAVYEAARRQALRSILPALERVSRAQNRTQDAEGYAKQLRELNEEERRLKAGEEEDEEGCVGEQLQEQGEEEGGEEAEGEGEAEEGEEAAESSKSKSTSGLLAGLGGALFKAVKNAL